MTARSIIIPHFDYQPSGFLMFRQIHQARTVASYRQPVNTILQLYNIKTSKQCNESFQSIESHGITRWRVSILGSAVIPRGYIKQRAASREGWADFRTDHWFWQKMMEGEGSLQSPSWLSAPPRSSVVYILLCCSH